MCRTSRRGIESNRHDDRDRRRATRAAGGDARERRRGRRRRARRRDATPREGRAAREVDVSELRPEGRRARGGETSRDDGAGARRRGARATATTARRRSRLEPNVGDVDPGMVAPRRANWDLKRDVEARLEKLERRTRRALVDVARDEARARAAMDA